MIMTRTGFFIAAVIAVALAAGCAPRRHFQPVFQPKDLTADVQSGDYAQNAEHFLFILDASRSMADAYQGRRKLEVAKAVVDHITRTLPDIGYQGALRVVGGIGFGNGGMEKGKPPETEMIYSFTDWATTNDMTTALQSVVDPAGENVMGLAIERARDDLSNTTGRVVLIVVSDGLAEDRPVAAVERLKAEFADRLCIYTVVVGESILGQRILEQVAGASGSCGFSENADNLMTGPGVASFVRNVFLTRTPEAPVVAEVAPEKTAMEKNEPIDADGDGVLDDADDCPGTPKGVVVNAQGCWVIENVLFEAGKWLIRPTYFASLDQVAHALIVNSGLHIELQGHTDTVGTAAENMELSRKRAEAVKLYLLNKGVPEARLVALGYGFSEPVAANNTEAGRAKNRRVELEPMRIEG